MNILHDKTLDFSTGLPGLHVLYGLNEAGKSTLHRALTHWFFGFPARTADAYLHANDKLRIGGRLMNSEGKELICYRRKGRKNTLLDVNNKPLEEKCLQAFLRGMKESQFTALCCFNHEHLRQGGEDLLNGGGDVGESLFEAGTGTLKVHDVLTELDKEKSDLFKPRGSKPLLNQTIRVYKEACKRIADTSLSADRWSEQAKKLDEAQQQNTQFTHQLKKFRAEQNRLERIKRTRPLLQRYRELKTKWTAGQDIAKLQSQIDAINIPQALLAQKAKINDLRERLGSHQKAARDLPGVRTEMRTVESDANALLRRIYPQLDLADVFSKLAITNPQREYLKKQATHAPALHEKQSSIKKRLSEITEQLIQQRNALDALLMVPDLTLLRATLSRACQYGNLEEIQTKEEQAFRLLKERAEMGLKQIGWTQDLAALEKNLLPRMERIDNFVRRFNELENDRQRIKERLLEARQRNDRSTQKMQKIKKLKSPRSSAKGGNNPSLSLFEAEDSQIYPFDSLNTHSTKGDSVKKAEIEVFEAFEETMLYSDELSDRLRREANRVAEYTMLLAEQKSAQREQEQQTKKWHTVEGLINKLQSEWEDSWKKTDIKPWLPAEMRGWLNDALGLRQQAGILREHRQHLTEQQQLITALCQELIQALTSLKSFVKGTILTRLPDLIEQGHACVNEVSNLQRQRENLHLEINNLLREQQRTQTAQQQANNALKQWQLDWAQALIPLHLPPDTPPETARNVLNDLDQVLNKIDKGNGLRRRVELMQRDADRFRHEVAAIVQKTAPSLVNEAAEQAVPALSNQLSQAEKDLTRTEQLQQHLHAEQQRLMNAGQQVQASQAHLHTLLEQAHCDDLTTLEEAEQASLHKKEVQQDLDEVEQQLLEQGEGMSLSDLAETAATVDIDQLPGQLQSCTEQIKNRL